MKTKSQNMIKKLWAQRRLWVLLLPALALFVVFNYKPMYGIIIVFREYKAPLGIWHSEWIGLKVFERMLKSQNFVRAFRNTLIISVEQIVFTFPAPIVFAILLNEVKQIGFKKTIQTISYLPHFVSWVIVSSLMKELLDTNGAINDIAVALGSERQTFLTKPNLFRFLLIITNIWKNIGWSSIIYLAALSGIDPQLYEAAAIDGASKIKQMWYITIPSLLPTISIMFLMRIGNILNVGFDQIFNMYNSAVMEVADILDTYVYREGLVSLNYSYSTAVGLLKNVIGLCMMLIINSTVNKNKEYGIV